MQYTAQYQVMEPGETRPYDCAQDDTIDLDHPTWLPNVGDSVALKYGGRVRAFIVLTRHFFIWSSAGVLVNIVVRPATGDEMDARLIE